MNALGQRRTAREQMLLAVCVSHSNLANFPVEICVRVSNVFAPLTSVFSSIPANEGLVETKEEKQGIDGEGWQHDPQLSCTNSKRW